MVDLFGIVLWPFKWVIEAILVAFHSGWSAVGLDPDAGLTWVLSILGLVLVVRAALIPLFVRQIKSQRKMMEIAPQLKKIQEKYKGKRDQFSREAMSRETMELYKRTGTSPFASCLPLLAQMPIFFSLFQVLDNAQKHPEAAASACSRPSSRTRSAPRSCSASRRCRDPDREPGHPARDRDRRPDDRADDGVAVHHAAADHVEERLPRDDGEPDVPAAEDAALRPAARLHLLGHRVPARRDVLLGLLEPLDHGPAVHRHPQLADARQRGREGPRGAAGQEGRQRKKQAGGEAGTTSQIEAAPAPRVNTQRNQPVGKNRAKRTGERRA